MVDNLAHKHARPRNHIGWIRGRDAVGEQSAENPLQLKALRAAAFVAVPAVDPPLGDVSAQVWRFRTHFWTQGPTGLTFRTVEGLEHFHPEYFADLLDDESAAIVGSYYWLGRKIDVDDIFRYRRVLVTREPGIQEEAEARPRRV